MATYNTINGQQTEQTMEQQLRNAGWGGGEDVATAYARTTGGEVTPMSSGGGSSSSSSSSGTPTSGQLGVSPQNLNNVLGNLQAKALQEYYNAKLALETDQEAYQKAAQSIANDLAIAGATGTYNGMPTQQAIKQLADIAAQQAQTMVSYAQQFGTWGTPVAGSQTLAAQKQAFDMSNQAAQLTGWYTPFTYTPNQATAPTMAAAPGTGGTPGTGWQPPTQDQYLAARVAQLQGQGFDPTRAQQTAVAEWNQGYAQSGNVAYGMPSGISFTAPAAAQPQTPAAAGGQLPNYPQQTIPGTGATLGVPAGYQAGQPVQTLAAQQQYWNQQFETQRLQQQTAQNYLTMMAGLRGPADWATYQKVLGATPGGMKDLVAAAAGQYVPGAGATTGVQPNAVTLGGFINSATGQPGTATSDQAAMNSLVAPNQMAPQTWNALTPSQQQMLLGQWEAQGYNKDDAQALFNQSLPRYGGTATAGAYKLV